jgi:pyruvate dehydrogenase E1 component alpha subunit
MHVIEAFEAALLRQPKPGFQLLSRGEEAVAVGICAALERRDRFLCSGRSIGPALARGIGPGALLAELVGKDGGPNRGRAGRGHVSMPAVGFFGAHAVVAGNLTVSAGVALAQQQLGTGAVALCLFGDGACGSGALHETFNVAALWRLPLVLVCNNNGYAISTPVSQGLAPPRLGDLSLPFGIPSRELDGCDVDAVAAGVGEAVAEARAGGGPRFVVARSVRLASHSTATREERPAAELEAARARDPVVLYRNRLLASGELDERAAAALEDDVAAEIRAAEGFAEAAAWPDGNEAIADV